MEDTEKIERKKDNCSKNSIDKKELYISDKDNKTVRLLLL